MAQQLTERQQWQLKGMDLYKHALEGSRSAQFKVSESIASGELPVQIAPLVRRQLRSIYEQVPKLSPNFTTRETVLNINVDEQYNIYTMGDQSNVPLENMGDVFTPGGLPKIGPRESYPEIGLTASGKTIRATKIGEAFGIDWESIVRLNGTNINLVDDAVKAFGRHAGNQEDIDVASLFVNAAGFRTTGLGLLNGATRLTAANGYVVPAGGADNPDLANPLALQNAVQFALTRTLTLAASGTNQTIPVQYTKYALITTVAYAPYAKQALATKQVTSLPNRAGTTRDVQFDQVIDYGAEIEVYGWKWLKTLYPGIGNAWFLVPIPDTAGDDLPVITSNFLQGAETPQFFVKDANSTGYGGGDTPYSDGDFDSDAVMTKVRHVHGANSLWNTGVVWSSGTNA